MPYMCWRRDRRDDPRHYATPLITQHLPERVAVQPRRGHEATPGLRIGLRSPGTARGVADDHDAIRRGSPACADRPMTPRCGTGRPLHHPVESTPGAPAPPRPRTAGARDGGNRQTCPRMSSARNATRKLSRRSHRLSAAGPSGKRLCERTARQQLTDNWRALAPPDERPAGVRAEQRALRCRKVLATSLPTFLIHCHVLSSDQRAESSTPAPEHQGRVHPAKGEVVVHHVLDLNFAAVPTM